MFKFLLKKVFKRDSEIKLFRCPVSVRFVQQPPKKVEMMMKLYLLTLGDLGGGNLPLCWLYSFYLYCQVCLKRLFLSFSLLPVVRVCD